MKFISDFWSAVQGFGNFASVYCLIKCLKTMFAGMFMLVVIILIRKWNRRQITMVNIGAMALLFPMALMGMNKLYYTRWVYFITHWMYQYEYIKPIYGKVYFGIMAILLIRYFWKSAMLRKDLAKMIPAGEEKLKRELIDKITAYDRTPCSKKYLCKVKIYLTEEKISPFSGGIFRPYIVIPQEITESWDKEEYKVVLSHELLHIRSGHILLLFFFAMLRIYWWVNPLIYLCDKILREDLEMACDESCIRCMGIGRSEYGQILLNMIMMLRGVQKEGTVAFLNRNYFDVLRKRIGHLSCQRALDREKAGKNWAMGIYATAFILFILIICATSYPRYTKIKEITLFDEDLQIVVFDMREVTDSVRVVNGEVFIDEPEFQKFLKEQQVSGEYVYISYDTIMKLPGMGGGGNTAMVSVGDHEDVLYLAADTWSDKWMIFMMKYLI